MSKYPRPQSSLLSSLNHKWAGIIARNWEDTWQIVADRDDRISHHRDFAVDL